MPDVYVAIVRNLRCENFRGSAYWPSPEAEQDRFAAFESRTAEETLAAVGHVGLEGFTSRIDGLLFS